MPIENLQEISPNETVEQQASAAPTLGTKARAAASGALAGLTGGSDLATKAVTGLPQSSVDYVSRGAPGYRTAGEVLGTTLRDIGATSIAGPAAFYGNAALNAASQLSDAAYDHDPRLSIEHASMIMLKEASGAALGHGFSLLAEPVVNGITAGGRAVMRSSAEAAGRLLKPTAENLRKVGGRFAELGERALAQGFFTKTAASAKAVARGEQQKIGKSMQDLLDLADSVQSGRPPLVPGSHVQKLMRQAFDGLRAVDAPAARSFLSQTARRVGNLKNFIPSDLAAVESDLGSLLAKSKRNGAVVAQLGPLKQQLADLADTWHANLGINAGAYRELQKQYAAQSAALASIPRYGAASIFRGVVAAGAGASAEEVARRSGLPTPVAVGAGVAAAGLLGGKTLGLKAIPETAKTVLGLGAAGLHAVGSAAATFEQGAFAQYIAKLANVQADEAARRVVAGTATTVVRQLHDHVLPWLDTARDNPQYVMSQAYSHAEASGLPQGHRDQAANHLQDSVAWLNKIAPRPQTSTNPFAPTGTRRMALDEQVKLARTWHGLTNPFKELQNPTPEGLEAIRSRYPATYQAYVQGIMNRIGPNTASAAPVRHTMRLVGLDQSVANAGTLIQQMYQQQQQQTPPPGSASGSKRPSEPFHLHMVESSKPGLPSAQEPEQ